MSKWIKVEDELPRGSVDVLACDTNGTMGRAWISWPEEDRWVSFDEDLDCGSITHWMPLPEAPTEV